MPEITLVQRLSPVAASQDASARSSDTVFQGSTPSMVAMEWFGNNWPIILVALAVFIIAAGLMRKIAKLAFVGVAVGAIGLVLWPMVSESL